MNQDEFKNYIKSGSSHCPIDRYELEYLNELEQVNFIKLRSEQLDHKLYKVLVFESRYFVEELKENFKDYVYLKAITAGCKIDKVKVNIEAISIGKIGPLINIPPVFSSRLHNL